MKLPATSHQNKSKIVAHISGSSTVSWEQHLAVRDHGTARNRNTSLDMKQETANSKSESHMWTWADSFTRTALTNTTIKWSSSLCSSKPHLRTNMKTHQNVKHTTDSCWCFKWQITLKHIFRPVNMRRAREFMLCYFHKSTYREIMFMLICMYLCGVKHCNPSLFGFIFSMSGEEEVFENS